jgi:hypothetical protein
MENSIYQERGKLICVPVPGESKWLKELKKSFNPFQQELKTVVYVNLLNKNNRIQYFNNRLKQII